MVVWVGSPNFHTQNDVPKRFIVMHWMVGRMAGTDKRFLSPASQVSAHYGVDGRVVHQYVHEKDYAFANGDTYANRHGISIEHAGGYLRLGRRVSPTWRTHETSAHLVAEIADRWKLGRLVVGKNVYPHKHFKATECPGTLNLDWIVKRANALR